MNYLVYQATSTNPAREAAPAPLRVDLWRPSVGQMKPAGFHGMVFDVWWLFHLTHAFANRDYAQLVIYDGDKLVHRSGIFPRYPRFPFMGSDDLQIGDTWTDPEYRGRGLATLAIHETLARLGKPGRAFWYIVEPANVASVRVIERAGFSRVAESVRTSRLGVRLLGAYVLTSALPSA
ncbi:MAG: GNAT family protein [Gemmatimonadaceae bacterium]